MIRHPKEKHCDSLVAAKDSLSFVETQRLMAVGLPNVLIWAYYFWKKDVEAGFYMKNPEYYARQNFQKVIYRLNQPFLRIDQSSFTNFSIFDRPYLESLFGGMEFPDGTFAIDQIEELIAFQKLFMEVVSETREEQMFTYPVLTFSLYYKDGKFQDEEFARWASAHNIKWSDSNFFVSDNIGVLSNCPMSGDTQIMYYSDRYDKFFTSQIKDVWNNTHRASSDERTIKVLSNGELVEARVNKFPDPIEYEVVLVNGQHIKMTANHLNKAYGKDYIKTKDLTVEDYLPVSILPFNASDQMTYEEGLLVGMFLGDGSYSGSNTVVFSLNDKKKQGLIDFILDYCPQRFAATIFTDPLTSSISGKQSCINVRVKSQYMRGLIEMFVEGDNALNKEISGEAFVQSPEFRRGIVDGLYKTDGGNSNRIYTSSIKLRDSLVSLLATLGVATTISEDNREMRLGTNTCYTVRYYTPGLKTRQKDVYIVKDGYIWFKIKEINKISVARSHSYCVEVLKDGVEPVFTLANGIVTHNCRLLSDTSKLDAFINSIGGTALSVGSCRVSTINLVRIAYESKFDKKKYLKILRDRVTLDCKALYSMRHIIKRNIEKGLLPNYQDGAVELDKQFCTIGGIGIYEVMDLFGLIDEDAVGNKSYSDEAVEFATKILDVINDVKDNFECGFTFNLEMIPAENCAGVICAADNLLYEQDKYFIYSNQWIPLMEKCTIQEKCRLGSLFDKKCGGGCIAHIDIEGRFPNEETAWDMLNYVASQGVIYFAFTTKISVCEDQHAFIGSKVCPKCGKPVADTYARVVGFYTPTSSYQKIRKKEFSKRQWYDVLTKNEVM